MSTQIAPIDTLSPGGNLDAYIQAVNKIPVLSREVEQQLSQQLRDKDDLDAARQLVMSHLRFVVYVAKSYSGYGLPEADLIQEGNVGLMKAVKRFDPKYGVRLVSFAVHWIKAEIHEFILRNWRIVKIATTKPQRKLFFNLRSAKKHLGWMSDKEVQEVAEQLGVVPEEVRKMESRLYSQDAAFDPLEDDEDTYTPEQFLADPALNPATLTETTKAANLKHQKLHDGMAALDERAREIIQRRWLDETKSTLHELAADHDISAERVRQLEQGALKKLKQSFN